MIFCHNHWGILWISPCHLTMAFYTYPHDIPVDPRPNSHGMPYISAERNSIYGPWSSESRNPWASFMHPSPLWESKHNVVYTSTCVYIYICVCACLCSYENSLMIIPQYGDIEITWNNPVHLSHPSHHTAWHIQHLCLLRIPAVHPSTIICHLYPIFCMLKTIKITYI